MTRATISGWIAPRFINPIRAPMIRNDEYACITVATGILKCAKCVILRFLENMNCWNNSKFVEIWNQKKRKRGRATSGGFFLHLDISGKALTKLSLKLNKKMGRCSMKNYESLPLRGFCLSRKVELKSVGCSQHREFCQNKLCLEKFESKCQRYN